MNLDSKTVILGLWMTIVFIAGSWLVGNQPVEIILNQEGETMEVGGGTRFPNGISADSTSPSEGEVRGTTFTITGASTLGSNSTSIAQVNHGTCYLRPRAATIAASSTALVECQGTAAWDASGVSALTGVDTGDTFQVILSTTTATETGRGIRITGAAASSTAGYIMLTIANSTGNTHTWPTSGSASGTASYIAIE